MDIFLTEKSPEESRSQWQKKIKSGFVLVNGELPSVHQFLKAGDEITEAKKIAEKKEKIKYPKYKVLFECADYLIVEKPPGLLTHRVGGELGMADQIVKDYPEIKKVGEADRAGIVHRLDRDASGLLVVARTPEFFEHIKKQFADRSVKKIYLALAYGEIPKDEEDLKFVIARGSEGRMAARPSDEEGKEAKTHIKILERFKNYTYLEAQIFTGRTHQIRAHLLAYGYGIVGDTMYKPRRQKIKNPFFAPAENALRSLGEERAVNKNEPKYSDGATNGRPESRLFLHSHILGFEDMSGNYVEYKSKLPKELKECLEKLK